MAKVEYLTVEKNYNTGKLMYYSKEYGWSFSTSFYLDHIGREGWELISESGSEMRFKRIVEEEEYIPSRYNDWPIVEYKEKYVERPQYRVVINDPNDKRLTCPHCSKPIEEDGNINPYDSDDETVVFYWTCSDCNCEGRNVYKPILEFVEQDNYTCEEDCGLEFREGYCPRCGEKLDYEYNFEGLLDTNDPLFTTIDSYWECANCGCSGTDVHEFELKFVAQYIGDEIALEGNAEIVLDGDEHEEIDEEFGFENEEKEYDFEVEDGVLIKYIGTDGNAIIPDDVTEIGDKAFYLCNRLTSVTVPDSVTKIGESAFYNCGKLTNIIIPNSVTRIGDYAFEACDNLESVTLSIGLTHIGNSAFQRCEKLTNVIIPDSVTNIGKGAFQGCEALEHITLPKGITEIKDETFDGCKSLVSAIIPDEVEEIGCMAFYKCKKMTSTAIPDSVEGIGIMAFDECKKLTIYASEGSYAEKYAKRERIPVSDIKEMELC